MVIDPPVPIFSLVEIKERPKTFQSHNGSNFQARAR
jgi:hypothetical protein